MRRDRELTVRHSAEELALLPALRHAIVEPASQAEVLVWALEDLCRRVAAGDQLGTAIHPDRVTLCAAALHRLERARAHRPPKRRSPRPTAAPDRVRPAHAVGPGVSPVTQGDLAQLYAESRSGRALRAFRLPRDCRR